MRSSCSYRASARRTAYRRVSDGATARVPVGLGPELTDWSGHLLMDGLHGIDCVHLSMTNDVPKDKIPHTF